MTPDQKRDPRPRKMVQKDYDDMGGILNNEPGKPIFTTTSNEHDDSENNPQLDNVNHTDEELDEMKRDHFSNLKENLQKELNEITDTTSRRYITLSKKLANIHKTEQAASKIFNELHKNEIIDDYFYKEGIRQIIIHGADSTHVDSETGENEDTLRAKIDLDVWSAMKMMELGGVKFAEGAKISWVNPKEKMHYDEEGKPYYNSVEKTPVLNSDGKKHFLFEPPFQVFDKKENRLYLDPGTVILDVNNTYGATITHGDVMQWDHHEPNKKYITSTTKELFNSLQNNENFKKNFKENTGTNDLEWFKDYIEGVTRVDNLDYDTSPKAWETYHNTWYAFQKYFNSSNREIALDLFKNYKNIHLDGFTAEELEYVIGLGNPYYNSNDTKKERKLWNNIKPLEHNGKSQNPEFFINHPLGIFNERNLLKIKDIVAIQKRAVENSNKSINESRLTMYMHDLNVDSIILGKVLLDEIDRTTKNYRNNFGAVAAYGNGYDSYAILNLTGNQKNEIFVSTKKNLKVFQGVITKLLKEEMGDKYNDDLVVVVRDSMAIIRDKSLKNLDTDRIRGIIARALSIGGYTEKKQEVELISKIDDSHQRTLEFLKRINKEL